MNSLLDDVQKLLELEVGDTLRLEHIKENLEKNKTVYRSDRNYITKLSQKYLSNIEESKPMIKEQKSDTITMDDYMRDLSELSKHVPEEPKVIDEKVEQVILETPKKPRSWFRAFGSGIAGMLLFLSGLGTIFTMYHYSTHIENVRAINFEGGLMMQSLYFFVIIPLVLLIVGGISIYYSIRIISKR